MKTLIIIFSAFLTLTSISCEKSKAINKSSEPLEKINGCLIRTIAIDSNNYIYCVTYERGTIADKNILSSYIPFLYHLVCLESETGVFKTIDNNFVDAIEILFDQNNNLWIRTRTNILKKVDGEYRTVFTGNTEFMRVDSKNNIWTGGFNIGLFKIDSELNITQFNSENSSLSTDNIKNIHINKYDVVWVALWDNQGILKIENEEFTIYNSENSNITSQNISCIISDKDDNIWIGTGHVNRELSLMKFDGSKWTVENPRNSNGEIINGIVSKLFADQSKIYIVAEKVNHDTFESNELITFDGSSWEKLEVSPLKEPIMNLIMDYHRQLIWINTFPTGIYKMKIE